MSNATQDQVILSHNLSSLHYEDIYKYTSVVLFSSLFLIGFVGNVLVIYVVFKAPKMRTPTNIYLVSLAAADCLVLLGATLPAIPEFFFYKNQWIYGRETCSILVFLQYLGINASSLSITAFTIERYIGICHPMKAQILCTTSRAKKIIGYLWLFSVLYNACWLYLATTKDRLLSNHNTIKICTYRISREQYRSIYMVDLMVFYVLPLMVTCVLYGLIGVTLHKSTKSLNKPITKTYDFKPTIQKLITDQSINKDFQISMPMERKDLLEKMVRARLQVVRMLIIVAVMFAVLWLPYRGWVVYNSFASKEHRFYNNWFILWVRLMTFLNSAINPILYSLLSQKFRAAFIEQTCIGRIAKTGSNSYSMTILSSTQHMQSRKTVEVVDKQVKPSDQTQHV